MNEHKKIYDVMIVGSGWGGLMSAMILSLHGWKVLVLEKNRQFGGSLQTFSFKKELFDACVHYIGSMNQGASLHQIFKYLGVLEGLDLEYLAKEGFDHIYCEHELIGKIPQGFLNAKEDFIQRFPCETQNIEQYFQWISDIVNEFPLYSLNDGLEEGKSKYWHWSMTEVLEDLFKDQQLIQLLMGNAFLYNGTMKTTPFYEHALIMFSYWQGAVKFKNGSSQLTRNALKVIRENGGVYLKNEKVLTIAKKQAIFEIETLQHKYYAQQVIYNGSLKTIPPLLSQEKIPKRWLKRIEQAQVAMSCFMIHAVIQPTTIPYKPRNIYWNSSDVYNTKLEDIHFWPFNFAIYFNEDRQNIGWVSSITILAYLSSEVFSSFYNSETKAENEFKNIKIQESYFTLKEELAEKLLSKIEVYFPEVFEKITDYSIATPLTLENYLNYPQGSMYGIMKNAEFVMKETFLTRSPLKGLWLTGQDIGMHGILGVSITSLVTCMQIMNIEDPSAFLKSIKEC